jgi:hypothetical protein
MNNKVTKFVVLVIISVIFQLFLAWPLMLIWNIALVPAIDGVHQIDWIQAWLIMMFVRVLFKTELTT